MSTMLDRMIQRTRGPLSSLEPVATPAFAAVPPSERGWAGPGGPSGPWGPWDQSGPSDSRAEVTADDPSAAAPRPEPRPGGHVDRPGSRTGQRADGRLGRPLARPVDDEHGDSGLTPVTGAPARPALALPSPMMPGPGQPPASRPTPRGQLAAENPHPEEDHREPGPDPAAMPAGHAGSEPRHSGERGIRARHAIPVAGHAQAAAVRPAEMAVVESGPVLVRPPGHWPASTAPSARPGQAATGRAATGFQGSGTEVTISIGHIEVRSAPAAENPRPRPPFRPRVSLADFLGQDRRS